MFPFGSEGCKKCGYAWSERNSAHGTEGQRHPGTPPRRAEKASKGREEDNPRVRLRENETQNGAHGVWWQYYSGTPPRRIERDSKGREEGNSVPRSNWKGTALKTALTALRGIGNREKEGKLMIDEMAFQAMLVEIQRYRAEVTEAMARQEVQARLETGREPLNETAQDIWWSYQKHAGLQ